MWGLSLHAIDPVRNCQADEVIQRRAVFVSNLGSLLSYRSRQAE